MLCENHAACSLASSPVRRGLFFSIASASFPAEDAPGGASGLPASSGRRGLRPPQAAANSGGPRRRAIPASPVPEHLPGLPPARGRRGRLPAGSTPSSGRSPPGTAGRRDPPRAFQVPSADSPSREARAAACPNRRGRAEPPRVPAPRGRRVPRGRLPGHAAPTTNRDGQPRHAAARPLAGNFALWGQTAVRTAQFAAKFSPVGTAGRSFRGANPQFRAARAAPGRRTGEARARARKKTRIRPGSVGARAGYGRREARRAAGRGGGGRARARCRGRAGDALKTCT